jgi:hypothetical protein
MNPSFSMFRLTGGVFGVAVLVSMANAVGMLVERLGLFN